METLMSFQRWLLVLLACMLVSWFDFGIQATTGAFFDVMLQHYGGDRKTTASVSGLFTAINQGSGILVGLLINKFGVAKISFIGSFLVPVGFFLCTFATSIFHVLIFFGFISALGVAMAFVSSAAMVRKICTGSYKKWLPLSLTLHSSCISFAGFTLPYLIHFFNETYSLPGTFMLFSGILANNVCISLLFFFVERNFVKKCSKDLTREKGQDVKTTVGKNADLSYSYSNKIMQVSDDDDDDDDDDDSSVLNARRGGELEQRGSPRVDTNCKEYFKGSWPSNSDANTSMGHDAHQTYVNNNHIKPFKRDNVHALSNDSDEIFVTKVSGEHGLMSSSTHYIANNSNCDANVDSKTDKKDIINELNEQSSQLANSSQNENKLVLNATMVAKDKKITRQSHRGVMARFKEAVFGHVNFVFACIFVTVAIVLGTQNSYLAVIIDIFESKGFSKELALNAYIPLNTCALICRILPGAVTCIDPILFVAVFALSGSAGQLVLLLSSNYAVCLVGVGLTGVTMGGVISAATIAISKTIDANKFALAFGQILTGVGLMTTSIAPTFGAMRDAWQSYDIVLTTTLITQAVGGIICAFAWIMKKKQTSLFRTKCC